MTLPDRLRRSSLADFPDVLTHADEAAVKRHPRYAAARAGNRAAALELVLDMLDMVQIAALQRLARSHPPTLVSVHTGAGGNAIPAALAEELGRRLSWPVDSGVVQTRAVAHDTADGFWRLSHQPRFDGPVQVGRDYVLVDDFVGMGATLANLRGHLESRGGWALAAVALGARQQSAKLALSAAALAELRAKHGDGLDSWWRDHFGHGFEALTESEARFLSRCGSAELVRERVLAAEQGGERSPAG